MYFYKLNKTKNKKIKSIFKSHVRLV